MTAPDDALRRCWRRVTNGAPAHLNYWEEELVARHAEPHRRYHTAAHVTWVLRHVDRLLGPVELGGVEGAAAVDSDAARAAALFHDVVYDPRSTTNEHDSAALAAAALREAGWPEARVATVHRWIEATAHQAAAASLHDLGQRVLLDADLAVLGAEPAAYQAYATGVRAEYAHLDDGAWRVGRAAVLRHFLDRDVIYLTEPMRRERERRARANLAAELAGLR